MSEIGKKYNMLTILDSQKKNKKNFLLCRCECGNEKWIRSDAVTSGSTKSCGCLKKKIHFEEDLGKTFNLLTVLDYKILNKKKYYYCRCTCGNEKWILSSSIKNNTTKSCGCLYNKIEFENDIGKRFNKWTILKQEIRDYKRYYYCKCDCGNEEWRQASSIRNNKSKECSFCLVNKIKE